MARLSKSLVSFNGSSSNATIQVGEIFVFFLTGLACFVYGSEPAVERSLIAKCPEYQLIQDIHERFSEKSSSKTREGIALTYDGSLKKEIFSQAIGRKQVSEFFVEERTGEAVTIQRIGSDNRGRENLQKNEMFLRMRDGLSTRIGNVDNDGFECIYRQDGVPSDLVVCTYHEEESDYLIVTYDLNYAKKADVGLTAVEATENEVEYSITKSENE